MTRALVLSGGGPVGIAWEAGLLAGLEESGVALGEADFILGTSAGSFVGSQLAMGRRPGDMAAAILAETQRVNPDVAAGSRPAGGAGAPNLGLLFQKMQEARAGVRDAQDVRREIGQFALGAKTMDEDSFIRSFGRQLSGDQAERWPERGYACTAVDAETGEFVLWTAESKVGLARAVASSCSVPGVYPPITINGRRYIDGGMRSGSNADVATGHELVVVVGLRTAGDAATSERMRAPLEQELQSLRDGGARTELILPDDASVAAFGANLMDGRVRPAAAKAGIEQGRALAAALKDVWG
ncbi:MAG TPA: patatin-like phospholipase family protein [Caulobacteraceae bacterium]|jgi:NTE family protein|nr:patatin-like phospholipase family protein [Caulobacteraceae bacterium]